MELRMRGVVQGGPAGVLVVTFREAPNADKVSAFLNENLGEEVEVTLRWPERKARTHLQRGHDRNRAQVQGELTDCASGAYWRTRDDKEE